MPFRRVIILAYLYVKIDKGGYPMRFLAKQGNVIAANPGMRARGESFFLSTGYVNGS